MEAEGRPAPCRSSLRRWALIVIGAAGTACESRLWLAGEGEPDVDTIDELARILHRARRDGLQVRLEQVTPDLAELIELFGLGEKLAGCEPDGEPQTAGPSAGRVPGAGGDSRQP